MIEIRHLGFDGEENKTLIHAPNFIDSSYSLCGEDVMGDTDRDIIDHNSKKLINCPNCITIIWGIHKALPLDSCDIKAVSKNKTVLQLYNVKK